MTDLNTLTIAEARGSWPGDLTAVELTGSLPFGPSRAQGR